MQVSKEVSAKIYTVIANKSNYFAITVLDVESEDGEQLKIIIDFKTTKVIIKHYESREVK